MTTIVSEDTCDRTPALPSPAQIALALIVVRTKPHQTSITGKSSSCHCFRAADRYKEHIENLRSHVVLADELSQTVSSQRVDNIQFWKDLYDKAQTEKSELLNRNLELEGIIRRANLHLHEASQVNVKKRHNDDHHATSANIQSKRVRLDNMAYLEKEPLEEGSLSTTPSNIQHLIRGISVLRTATSVNKRSDMLVGIRLICQVAGTALRDKDSNNKIGDICSCVSIAYTPMVEALAALDAPRITKTNLKAGQSIIISLFKDLLVCLHSSSLEIVLRRNEEQKERQKKPRSNTKKVQKAIDGEGHVYDHSCFALVKTLLLLVTKLDLASRSHYGLLEGLLCTFLDRLGSTLSLLVFADPEISLSDQCGILPPSAFSRLGHLETNVAIAVSQSEGLYLAYILRKIIEYLREDRHSELQLFGSLTPLRKPAKGDGLDMFQKVRDTLQRTLLRGVFGENDELFKNSLHFPTPPEEKDIEDMYKHMKNYEKPSEWLVGQVWDHLGWDVLSGEAFH